jgi:tetratricopeptide (TPR) repeat protein
MAVWIAACWPASTRAIRCGLLRARLREAMASALLAALLLHGPAAAETLEMLRLRCTADGTDPAPRIQACSTLIAAKRESAANRSIAYYNRGNAWRERGTPDAAMADYDQAIRLNRGNSFAFNNRGIIWHARGEIDRALADYDESIRLNPRHARAFHNRGNAWRDKGDPDRALAAYDAAIRLDPQEPLALANRCLLRVQRGDGRLALADCDSAVARMRPDNPWPLLARAGSLLLLEERGAAGRDIAAGLRQAQDDNWFLWLRALLRRQRGQEALARQDLAAAGSVGPAAPRLFGAHLLNGARPEGRLEPGAEHALPETLICLRREAAEALAAGLRAGDAALPAGCARQGVLFLAGTRLPLPSFAAEVVGAETYATLGCDRLSLREGPCPLAWRPAMVVEGRALRPGADAWEVAFAVLDARLDPGAGAPAVTTGPVPGSPAVATRTAPERPTATIRTSPLAPGIMDAPSRGGYEVGLADRSPSWLLPPLTMPLNGTGTPR